MDIKRVVPVAIRAASCWIFSNSSFSYWAQLSQTTSPYSIIGRIKAVYIISSDLRSNLNLSFRIVLILVHALSFMYWIWWCHVPSLEKYSPRCLCESTSLICWFCMKSGGCAGLFTLREITREFVFGGWKVTSHFSAQSSIFTRSEVRSSADVSGSVTTIYRLVSSAKRRILEPMSLTMSLM